MLSVFVPFDTSLRKAAAADLAALPETASGSTSSSQRRRRTTRGAACRIAVPTREDMQEIEISSRLYIENGRALHDGNPDVPVRHDMPKTRRSLSSSPATAWWTVRYDEPKPFALVENNWRAHARPASPAKWC